MHELKLKKRIQFKKFSTWADSEIGHGKIKNYFQYVLKLQF